MKKAELEAKIIELEKKLAVLEAQLQCLGHCCNQGCHLPLHPYHPNYTQPYWTVTSGTSGNVTFGNIS